MTIAALPEIGQSIGSLGDAQSAQAQAALKIKGKAKAASEQFEAMFLNSTFQEMFTKVDGDGPFGGSGA
jgi:peptidoglycan hydrolase FlgJ